MTSKVNVSQADGDRVTVALAPNLSRHEGRVEVDLWVHETGVVTVELDTDNTSNIDVDVDDCTVLIMRDGKIAQDRSIQKAVGELAGELRDVFSAGTKNQIQWRELSLFNRIVADLVKISKFDEEN